MDFLTIAMINRLYSERYDFDLQPPLLLSITNDDIIITATALLTQKCWLQLAGSLSPTPFFFLHGRNLFLV